LLNVTGINLSQSALFQIQGTSEQEYKDQGLADTKLTEAALINAIVNTPIMLERPIVMNNGKAVIGRPPENVLSIL